MKISPVLPVALSALLTTTLAAPLALRYPSPADAEKRADTFLRPKTTSQSFDEAIHDTLNFGTGEPLLLKKDATPAAVEKRAKGSLTSDGEGTSDFSTAMNEDLDFGGTVDPLLGNSGPSLTLFKKAVNAIKRATGSLPASESSNSFSTAMNEDIEFGGTTDPLLGGSEPTLTLFRKAVEGAKEKVATVFNA
ncbi:MAG: hypothetical protein Q9195_004203 [Heterodermia aff. obscurata]